MRYMPYVIWFLHCALTAAQCIVIGPVCLCVGVFACGSVTTITWNCAHRSSPKWVCRRPSWAPGKGVWQRGEIFFGSAIQPARSVCVSPSAFSSYYVTAKNLCKQRKHNQFKQSRKQTIWKKRSEETQTLRAGSWLYSKAEPKIFAPPQTLASRGCGTAKI